MESSLDARKHPHDDLIVISRTPGRVITVDYAEARALVDQVLDLLAAYDTEHRVGEEASR